MTLPCRLWSLSCLLVSTFALSACGSDSASEADAVPDSASDVQVEDGTEDASVDVVEDLAVDDADSGDALPDASNELVEATVATALQALLDEHVVFSAEPGITLALFDAQGRYWEGAAGVADIKKSVPMESDTGFRVGSNTKPFIATLVLMEVEKGTIDLDAPLSDYLEGYDKWKDITIRELVGMQSGIADFLTVPELMLAVISDPTKEVTHEYILDFVKDRELLYPPSGGANYSNTNYLLLGMILEKVTGVAVEQLLQEEILAPLGLKDTFLDLTGAENPKVSHGYMDLNLVGMIFGVPPAVLAFIPQDNIVGGTVIDSSYLFHPSLTWTAGALVSTAHDMAVFMKALLGGEILSAETVESMEQTKELNILGEAVQYGLGLQVRKTDFGDAYGHGGLNFGYQAGTYKLLDHGITLSHMHNYLPEQSDLFQNGVLDILINGVTEVPVVCTPPEGFFDGLEDGTLMVRFKGPINGAEAEVTVAGIGNFGELADGETVPLYGLGTQIVEKTTPLGERLEMNSLAPGTKSDAELLSTTVYINSTWLDGIGGTEPVTLPADSKSDLFVTVAEVDLTDGTTNPEKLCFVAVRDLTKPAKLYLCDADGFQATDGAMLRTFAAVPLTRDPTVVADTLAGLFLPECLCYKAQTSSWGLCN